MDRNVPNLCGGAAAKALGGAERAMEEHEIALLAELHDRTVDHISPHGTEERRRATLLERIMEDPEALDLYMRLALMQLNGGGSFVREVLAPREDTG